MRFGEVLQLDNGVLLVVFFEVCFELFGDLAGVDCCFHARVSFGKE
jgi:hypothetical protein